MTQSQSRLLGLPNEIKHQIYEYLVGHKTIEVKASVFRVVFMLHNCTSDNIEQRKRDLDRDWIAQYGRPLYDGQDYSHDYWAVLLTETYDQGLSIRDTTRCGQWQQSGLQDPGFLPHYNRDCWTDEPQSTGEILDTACLRVCQEMRHHTSFVLYSTCLFSFSLTANLYFFMNKIASEYTSLLTNIQIRGVVPSLAGIKYWESSFSRDLRDQATRKISPVTKDQLTPVPLDHLQKVYIILDEDYGLLSRRRWFYEIWLYPLLRLRKNCFPNAAVEIGRRCDRPSPAEIKKWSALGRHVFHNKYADYERFPNLESGKEQLESPSPMQWARINKHRDEADDRLEEVAGDLSISYVDTDDCEFIEQYLETLDWLRETYPPRDEEPSSTQMRGEEKESAAEEYDRERYSRTLDWLEETYPRRDEESSSTQSVGEEHERATREAN